MAALTDAMKWYGLGADMAPRLKYHFNIEIYSSQAQEYARDVYNCVRTVELPKYSIDTQVVNAWNVQQLIPTKVVFEPLSISFNDTHDNRFQKFIKAYLAAATDSFQPITSGYRTGFDTFGLKMQDTTYDVIIEKIVIRRFYGADADRQNFGDESIVTLYRPKIIDVQHDTLDYSASEAITWQISIRYESMTYEEIGGPPKTNTETAPEPTLLNAGEVPVEESLGPGETVVDLTNSPLISGGGIGGVTGGGIVGGI